MTTPTDRPGWARGRAAGARALRSLAGVDEQLLDRVPAERARYTSLGGVVLGTAVIASFSMLMALGEILGGFRPVLLLPMLIWGLFVLNLDRWLVSSSGGIGWGRRAGLFGTRLAVAAFFGLVIAEPLVLRIFESAIVKHVEDARGQELRDLTGALTRCNPDSPATPAALTAAAAPQCTPYRLNLQTGQETVAGELLTLSGEAQTLRRDLKTDTDEQARRDLLAANECNGFRAPGTSGRAGRGPECLAREGEAADFRQAHPTGPRTERLNQLDRRVGELAADQAEQQRTYQQRRADAIAEQVRTRTASQGPIGLLERFAALDELTSANGFLAAAKWFVRLFFVAVDCLPVLVKFISGSTRYERWQDYAANSAQRQFHEEVETEELERVSDLRSRQQEIRNDATARQAESDEKLRRSDARRAANLNQDIDELAAQLDRAAAHNGVPHPGAR